MATYWWCSQSTRSPPYIVVLYCRRLRPRQNEERAIRGLPALDGHPPSPLLTFLPPPSPPRPFLSIRNPSNFPPKRWRGLNMVDLVSDVFFATNSNCFLWYRRRLRHRQNEERTVRGLPPTDTRPPPRLPFLRLLRLSNINAWS